MKLSTKSTYGLRAMVNVAMNFNKEATSIAAISESEGISISYLEQLLNRLRKSGLVKSIRGPRGGYVLSKSPEKITVADIVRTLEGTISPIHCVTVPRDVKKACKRTKSCVPHQVWKKLADSINDCLRSITLKDLCTETRRRES